MTLFCVSHVYIHSRPESLYCTCKILCAHMNLRGFQPEPPQLALNKGSIVLIYCSQPSIFCTVLLRSYTNTNSFLLKSVSNYMSPEICHNKNSHYKHFCCCFCGHLQVKSNWRQTILLLHILIHRQSLMIIKRKR